MQDKKDLLDNQEGQDQKDKKVKQEFLFKAELNPLNNQNDFIS